MDTMTTERLQSLLSKDGSVRALLEHRVEASPDKTFIKWRGTDYTYAQIDGMANSTANSLLGLE